MLVYVFTPSEIRLCIQLPSWSFVPSWGVCLGPKRQGVTVKRKTQCRCLGFKRTALSRHDNSYSTSTQTCARPHSSWERCDISNSNQHEPNRNAVGTSASYSLEPSRHFEFKTELRTSAARLPASANASPRVSRWSGTAPLYGEWHHVHGCWFLGKAYCTCTWASLTSVD